MRRERTVDLAQRRGGEWTKREARADLWLHAVAAQAAPQGWPTIRQWVRRWGWTRKRVRHLVHEGRRLWWPSTVLGAWWEQEVTTRWRGRGTIAAESAPPTKADVPAAPRLPSVLQMVLELDAWWASYGSRWAKSRALVFHRGWTEEDLLSEIRVTLIARQNMPSRFDPSRASLSAYVGLLARSRILQLLERRAELVLDYDDERHGLVEEEESEHGEAIGLALRRRRRKPPAVAEPRPRPPAVVRRRARPARRPSEDADAER